jgi:hypothetical protein
MDASERRALLATVTAGALLALAVAQLRSAEVWGGLTPADCAEYCESSDRCGALATRPAIQQTANSWSNLAYLFVGLEAVFRSPTPGAVAFAASCALLAGGSFAFHASVTREAQWLDVAGMFVALGAIAARALHDVFGIGWRLALTLWAIVSAALVALKWQVDTRLVLAALGIVVAGGVIASLRHGRGRAGDALLALALIAIGYAVREVDVRHIWCDPASLIQGHAAWHVLAAASLWTAWRFFDRV